MRTYSGQISDVAQYSELDLVNSVALEPAGSDQPETAGISHEAIDIVLRVGWSLYQFSDRRESWNPGDILLESGRKKSR